MKLPLTALRGALLSLCAATETSGAQESPELVTDRPDQTESSVVVPPGYVQVETGVTYTDAGRDGRTASFPEMLTRIGVHERLEIRLGISGWTREFEGEDTSGFGDGELGLKLYLVPERGWRPETALLASVSVPMGEDGYSTERFDPAFRFNFSHSLSDRLSLGYNLGMAWETIEEIHEPRLLARYYNGLIEDAVGGAVESALDGNGLLHPFRERLSASLSAPLLRGTRSDRDTMATFQYTATLGIGLTERWGVFAEFFGDIPANAPGGPEHLFDAGFTYLIRDNMQWDIAGGIGLNGAADDWFVGTGFTIRFH